MVCKKIAKIEEQILTHTKLTEPLIPIIYEYQKGCKANPIYKLYEYKNT